MSFALHLIFLYIIEQYITRDTYNRCYKEIYEKAINILINEQYADLFMIIYLIIIILT